MSYKKNEKPQKEPSSRERYSYYPDGDRDPMSRNTRVDLVCEDGQWRYLGESRILDEKYLTQMTRNIQGGRAKLYKVGETAGDRSEVSEVIRKKVKHLHD